MIASLYCFNLGENKICKLKDQISVINFYESNYRLRCSRKKNLIKTEQLRRIKKRLYFTPKMSVLLVITRVLLNEKKLHGCVLHSDKRKSFFYSSSLTSP